MSHRNHFISCSWVYMAAIFHGNITQEVMDSNWEEVGRKSYKIRSLGQGWTNLCCWGGIKRDKSWVIIGIMISSAKRQCNKYLSFLSDGEVFHLRLYPEGELSTAVAEWCQVLFGSVDIDYLSCSKLSLQVQKNVCCFFPRLPERFWAILTGEALQTPRCRALDTRGNFQLYWDDT